MNTRISVPVALAVVGALGTVLAPPNPPARAQAPAATATARPAPTTVPAPTPSVAELEAQIAHLQAQIDALQARVQRLQGTPFAMTLPSPPLTYVPSAPGPLYGAPLNAAPRAPRLSNIPDSQVTLLGQLPR